MDSMDEEPSPVRWRRPRGLAFFVLPAVLALIGYGFTLGDFFLSDDFILLENASRAEDWSSASKLGGGWQVRWFRPLGFWSWWLEYPLFGLEPWGYRVTNLLVHVLDAGLCAWLVAILSKSDRAGTAAGAAFAVLPNHAEAVTWICARFDLLCALGMLVSFLAWIRWSTAERPRAWQLVLCALALLFAVASKEIGFGVLLMIPVLTLGFLGRPTRRHWIGYAVVAGAGALWFVIRWHTIGGIGGIVVNHGPPLQVRFHPWIIRHFTAQALRFAFAPLLHERFPAWHPLVSVPLGASLLALVACARAGLGARFARFAALFLVLFLVSLLPMVTWSILGPDNQSARYVYVPTLFSCGIFGAAFGLAADRRAALGSILCTVAVLVWLVGLVRENRIWGEASRITRLMVETFPSEDAAPEPHVVVTGLPDNHEGAFVFRNGFGFAIQLFAPSERQLYERTSEEWELELERRRGPIAFLRWDDAAQAWVRGERPGG